MEIGSLSANIAGDHRYTDRLSVIDEGDKVRITVSSTGAVGGMDGPGGAYEPFVNFNETCERSPKAVLTLIKKVISNANWNFKRYGKPTRRFWWAHGDNGISLATIKAALADPPQE